MSTELHLTITAHSAEEALRELVQVGRRAARELGGGPPPANTEPAALPKGNGAGGPQSRHAPAEWRSDKDKIVEALTDLFICGDPTVRERITALRDRHGAQRLRELGDEAVPEAARLLDELRGL